MRLGIRTAASTKYPSGLWCGCKKAILGNLSLPYWFTNISSASLRPLFFESINKSVGASTSKTLFRLQKVMKVDCRGLTSSNRYCDVQREH